MEDALTLMSNLRTFAVHRITQHVQFPAKGFNNALQAEAHAEGRDAAIGKCCTSCGTPKSSGRPGPGEIRTMSGAISSSIPGDSSAVGEDVAPVCRA